MSFTKSSGKPLVKPLARQIEQLTIMNPVAIKPPKLPHAMAMIDRKGTDSSTSYAKGDVDDDIGGRAIGLTG